MHSLPLHLNQVSNAKDPEKIRALHNLGDPSATALGHLGIPSDVAERVIMMVTSWAQDERRREIGGFERILRGMRSPTGDTNFLKDLKWSVNSALTDEYLFGGDADSTCWSGTDTFGNLRLSQCLGKRAISTLIRPATAEWAKCKWPAISAEGRLAILLLLFYAGAERAVDFLRYLGDHSPRASYTEMRERQLESDRWIIKCPPFYNLVGPDPGGGIEILPTSVMRATVLLVRDLAMPIALIIGMIATISNSKGWGKKPSLALAIVSAGISFFTILIRTFWGKIFPGTLEQWHVYGPTRITHLSKGFGVGHETLKRYQRASIAATFSGSVKRTALGSKSSWAPDEGQVVFYSTDPVDVTVLADFGLVRGTDRVLGGHIMLRNVYGRTTGVKVEVIEEYTNDHFHSYHMPSSGQIDIWKSIDGSIT